MNLPIININNLDEIRNACKNYGFFYVPFNSDMTNILNYTKNYFSLNEEIKLKDIMTPNGLGYAPLKRVKLNKTIIEMKESYSFRNQTKNDILENYYNTLSDYSKLIYSKIIESLNINNDLNKSFNTLTLIHYPEYEKNNNNIIGIAPHTDWGLLSILFTTTDGLQIYVNNEWINIPTIENHFIVNIGDMLEIISNGVYKSTLHRVLTINEKYSIVFFFEPDLDYLVKPNMITEKNKYNEIYFKDYLKMKLKESYDITFNSV